MVSHCSPGRGRGEKQGVSELSVFCAAENRAGRSMWVLLGERLIGREGGLGCRTSRDMQRMVNGSFLLGRAQPRSMALCSLLERD